MKISVVKNVLDSNNIVARKNREIFKEKGLIALNLISSPGSGKTTLLQKTIDRLNPAHKSAVIVGDLQTTRDAERLEPFAKEVIQINTGMSCHLYANQISESLGQITLKEIDFLFIENVGNMVCPGEFDLGENLKVVLLSLPEGDDKVAKYPTIFRAADIVLLTKIDLMGVLKFDLKRVMADLEKLNSSLKLIKISSESGEGMDEWLNWLKAQRKKSVGVQAKFIPE
ncbi:MAG: hydrogenase nickel incorporation protein HypB [Candidatus Omnitrophica bacterium]|nr:hydrogenase nickel incorporation protein HypB [Candidatus Omnitrophota bacterium]